MVFLAEMGWNPALPAPHLPDLFLPVGLSGSWFPRPHQSISPLPELPRLPLQRQSGAQGADFSYGKGAGVTWDPRLL